LPASTIAFEVTSGVISFHWTGPGCVKIHTQYRTREDAIEAFQNLQREVNVILDTLFQDFSSPGFKTEPPPASASVSYPPDLASVMADPRLVARQRPTPPANGETNYAKLPPRAALSAAQKLAEDMVAAYSKAQGRLGTSPPEGGDFEPIVLPQAKTVAMQTERKVPTHEEALAEARMFIEKQRAAMGLTPSPPNEIIAEIPPILPPPPPPETAEDIASEISKSS
jgi:hypothetical protein